MFFVGALVGMFGMYLYKTYKIEKRETTEQVENGHTQDNFKKTSTTSNSLPLQNIDELTREQTIVDFVKKNHELPDYYLTKSEARRMGWIASKGNLCEVLPGRAIGGDKFSNREKSLPQGNSYFEADVNYNCGNRGADRIVYTNDGDVWLTHDHYKTFEKQ